MYMDTYALSLGAVLMQEDARGKHRAVAYASRTLNQVELNYSVTHQKALTVVWAQTFSEYYPRLPYNCLYRQPTGH